MQFELDGYNVMRKLISPPHEHYLNQKQASINATWENSTQNHFIVLAQTAIGSDEYTQMPISIDEAIDMGTGFKKGDDFKIFSYKDITIDSPLGLMYKYYNNYWITVNTNKMASPINSVEVRRCNNQLKWINPLNGALITQPCCVDYDLSSPQPLKDKDIIVANAHIVVIVQGNDNTSSISKNQRFIFNGQPFKVVAFQNLLDTYETDSPTLLYIDMYLDTEEESDDIINNIANATDYNYKINIIDNVSQQVSGFTGTATCEVTLNGNQVERNVVWMGNECINIDNSGQYALIGSSGDVGTITVTLDGNEQVTDSMDITIVTELQPNYEIVMNNLFTQLGQGESVEFEVRIYNNGVPQNIPISYQTSGADNCFTLLQDGFNFTLTCLYPSIELLTLSFMGNNIQKDFEIELVSLF